MAIVATLMEVKYKPPIITVVVSFTSDAKKLEVKSFPFDISLAPVTWVELKAAVDAHKIVLQKITVLSLRVGEVL